MRMKVITGDDGEIVGTTRSSSPSHKSHAHEDIRGEIVPMPGQRMHEIDVPDEVVAIEDPDELHRRVKTYLPKKG